MNIEIRDQVIERLKNYCELEQGRNILKYEMEHPTVVLKPSKTESSQRSVYILNTVAALLKL